MAEGNDPPPKDFEPIADSVERQRRKVEALWKRQSSVDPEKLAKELADIEFDPEHRTTLGTETITREGKEIEIHKLLNFPWVFGGYNRVRRGDVPTDRLEELLKDQAASRHYEEVFSGFQARYPNVYGRMVEVSANIAAQAPDRTVEMEEEEREAHEAYPEEMDEWKYIASMSYSAMAEIALEKFPGYDLQSLYLGPA